MFGCTICHEILTESPSPDANSSNSNNVEIVALPCGHVFHGPCISQWFNSRLAQCPCCTRRVGVGATLRIFPSGYEEFEAINNRKKKELEHLNQELLHVNNIMSELGNELDTEKNNNVELRRKFDEKEEELSYVRQLHATQIEDLENRASAFQDTIKKHDEDMQTLQKSLETVEEERDMLKKSHEKEIRNLEMKLSFLKESEDTAANKINKVSNLLRQENLTASVATSPISIKASTPKYANKSNQTDHGFRDPSVLQARLISYTSSILHMMSEVESLKKELKEQSTENENVFDKLTANNYDSFLSFLTDSKSSNGVKQSSASSSDVIEIDLVEENDLSIVEED